MIVPVQVREPRGYFASEVILYDRPVEVSELGVAYHVLNTVERVVDGSPAAKAGLQPGDVLVMAKLLPPAKEILGKLESISRRSRSPSRKRNATGRRWFVPCRKPSRARNWR